MDKNRFDNDDAWKDFKEDYLADELEYLKSLEEPTLKEMFLDLLNRAKESETVQQLEDFLGEIAEYCDINDKIEAEITKRKLNMPEDELSKEEYEDLRNLKDLRMQNINKIGEDVIKAGATAIGIGVVGTVKTIKKAKTLSNNLKKKIESTLGEKVKRAKRKAKRKIRKIKRSRKKVYRASKTKNRKKFKKSKTKLTSDKSKKRVAKERFKKRENQTLKNVLEKGENFSKYLLGKVNDIVKFKERDLDDKKVDQIEVSENQKNPEKEEISM